MQIKVPEVLRFFDERPEGSKGHATSIVALMGEDLALGLLVRYLREHWDDSTAVIKDSCTTGQPNGKGPRLDGWIRTRRNGKDLLLQKRWQDQWNGSTFSNPRVAKVLTPMKRPEDLESLPVEPAVCFWYNMHPTGADEPLFSVPVRENGFERVWVFSMSSYLRSLNKTSIDVEMPRVKERLRWIHQLL